LFAVTSSGLPSPFRSPIAIDQVPPALVLGAALRRLARGTRVNLVVGRR
jgi:hypothetical protein